LKEFLEHAKKAVLITYEILELQLSLF